MAALESEGHHLVMSDISQLIQPSTKDSDILLSGYGGVSLDLSGFSPDASMMKAETKSLRSRMLQLSELLQTEQDTTLALRKKLLSSEKQRIEANAKANAESGQQDGELTKLRAQLERGEAARQNLEFELAKARKDVNVERKTAGEREGLMTEAAGGFKNKVAELTGRIASLGDELERSRSNAQSECDRLRTNLEEKEQLISEYRIRKDADDTQLDRLQAAITQKDKVIESLEDKLQELNVKERHTGDALRQQVSNTELAKEKEDHFRREYEAVTTRVRLLEEGIEAERAAHLESKFNSEIIQLRIRDLENALKLEKSSKSEAVQGSDKLHKQIGELKQAYEEERKCGHQTREKLESAEKEYASLNRQLNQELEDKRQVIQKLSGQLDVHQKNFDSLKLELNKAKKRQVHLEESFLGTSKEIELLLENFSFDTKPVTAGKKKASTNTQTKKKEVSKPPSLAVLMENLRHLMIDYKRRLDDSISNLTQAQTHNDTLTKECRQYKDVMWAKDKTLESTQQDMSRTSKELRKAQSDVKDLNNLVKQLKTELDSAQKSAEKERRVNKTLAEQISKVSTKWKTGEQVSMEFLQVLSHQLLATHRQPGSKVSAPTEPVSCWTDLALRINDQVAVVLTELHRAQDKVTQLEAQLAERNNQLELLKADHDSQVEKLRLLTHGQAGDWLKQKEDMEKHYTQLLSEIHSRQNKTQSLADQAWEKVRVTGSVQHGLEGECTHLREALSQYKTEHATLLATCALLLGTLYPLYTRCTALAQQRRLLTEQLTNFIAFKREVQALVQALTLDESGSGQVDGGSSGRGLLRFRRAAVVVMAANRLARGAESSRKCTMFTATDALPGMYSVLVCGGLMESVNKAYTPGVSTSTIPQSEAVSQHTQQVALSWLSSSDLLSTILATMSDLQPALETAQGGEPTRLVSSARGCFNKLVCHLPAMFSGWGLESGPRDRAGLCRALGQGLGRALGRTSHNRALAELCGSDVVLSALQHRILDFTQRLHTAEVERRDLRVEILALRQAQASWQGQSDSLHRLQQEVPNLRNMVENSVERERFGSVCAELNSALQREQQAQELLQEQSQQICQLSNRIDAQLTEDTDRNSTLDQAVKDLSEAKMEMKRQEQRFRQQNKHTSAMEDERKELSRNVKDAENALKTAARDRDVLTTYAKNVEEALEKIRSQLALSTKSADSSSFSHLLSADLLPPQLGKPGQDFSACQHLVSVFVDCQHQLASSIAALQEEVESHRKHIRALKNELNEACKREYGSELEKMILEECKMSEEEPVKLSTSPQKQERHGVISITQGDDSSFSPLMEDTNNESYQPATPAGKDKPLTGEVRSPTFHPLPKSAKRSSTRRKVHKS